MLSFSYRFFFFFLSFFLSFLFSRESGTDVNEKTVSFCIKHFSPKIKTTGHRVGGTATFPFQKIQNCFVFLLLLCC